jgi:hypothetical protein
MAHAARASKTAINSIQGFNITTLKKRKSNSKRTFLNNIKNKKTLKHVSSKRKYTPISNLQMQINQAKNGLKQTPKRKSRN